MRWVRTPQRRALVAAALLLGVTCGALADALVGGRPTDSAVVPLAAAVTGFLAGAWLSPSIAVAGCGLGTAALAAANQVADPGAYSLPNDLFFYAVLLGGTALAGAVVDGRRQQVRELRRLSAIRQQQRADEVRAARLEERNRILGSVVESLVERLGALVVQSSGMAREPAGVQGAQALARMEATARAALTELRETVGSLREPEPAPAVPPRTGPAQVEDSMRRAGRPTWADVLVGCSGVPLAFESVAGSAARGPVWANVLAGIAVGLPLAVRRRQPLGAVVGMVVVATLMSAWLTPLPVTVSVLLPLTLAAYSLGSRARGRTRAVGLLVLVVGTGTTALVSPAGSADASGIAPTLVWMAVACLAGVVAQQHARRARELRALIASIEAGQHQQLRLATAEQRVRTARDLHDSVAHAMTVVCLQAEAARQHPHDESLRRSCVDTIEATSRGAMDELRRGLVELDAPRGDAVALHELNDDVVRLAGSLGLAVDVRFSPGTTTVSAPTADVVRRVLRESLVNVARHAPRARVTVRCTADPDGVEIQVLDDGTTAADGTRSEFEGGTGTGLRGLGELLTSVGGHVRAERTSTGFLVAARLPSLDRLPA